ncbi:MAG: DUF721 domain-containing protein [Acidobacteriota bacterium]|nr:MAG: DUF721 domain-containing protein [Acidobacteriota bacterium]
MQRLVSCLPSILRSVSKDERTCFIFLKELWPQIVGDEVARKTRVLDLSEKRLDVGVPSEAWQMQLRSLTPVILASITRMWGCRPVERIEMKIDPDIM